MIKDSSIIKRHKKLCEEIVKYNYAYYVLSEPLVEDSFFDSKYLKLLELEEKYKDILDISDSPTQKLGSLLGSHKTQEKHDCPMLSLSNAWCREDIENFYKRIQKIIKMTDLTFCCEPKIDGIAISLHYENGDFVKALTRGDGFLGENITQNVQEIFGFPTSLNVPASLSKMEIRGEIVIHNEDFVRYNAQHSHFSNPRNAASGILRHKEISPSLSILRVYAFEIVNSPFRDQEETLKQLKMFGMPTIEKYQLARSVDEMMAYQNFLKEEKLPFNTDGAVYKLNELDLRGLCGSTQKSPRWAVAYKFKSDTYETTIKDIFYSVGRNGAITPVASLSPVNIEGVTITKVTLHNVKDMIKNRYGKGHRVLIKRSGGVIPKIVCSLETHKDVEQGPITCSSCDSLLEDYKCLQGWSCSEQAISRIIHLVSRDAFDIDGLGDKNIRQLFSLNIIRASYDIFHLKAEDLLLLENWKERKTETLMQAIHRRKNITFARFLYALSVPNLGLGAARKVAKSFPNLADLVHASLPDLESVCGSVLAAKMYSFLRVEQDFIERLYSVVNIID